MLEDIDVEALWAPLDGDAGCGPNLEYDPEFMQLEEAARGQPGQEFANSDTGTRVTIEGQDADWGQVFKLADGLMQRTRDVRVATYFARALVRTEGFVGARLGLKLIDGLLERFWSGVHPELDPDDDNDPTMRVNALAPLVASEAFIDDLRASWLLRSRQSGVLTVRNVEVAQGKLPSREGEQVYSESQVSGMLSEALELDADLGATIEETIELVSKISGFLQAQVGVSRALDFKPLQTVLHSVRQAYMLVAPVEGGEEAGAWGEEDGASTGGSSGGGGSSRSGEIRSRQDVVTGIDKLIEYLERAEPSNPAQILLKRAKRVVNMSFLEALNEIAPDALQQAELILGDQLNKSEY
ncbi:type VI secretion system protein TssA [Uliginosibacterium sp. H3]|uniref:Type VI secretion system protein TssA n=1 Tax=Uliginosibacterium silvisoli TaxID=3114758 RepID=A0ABU6K4I5_9RHOO|nr:type VI secretion system protein TssA [Uliginosibacterium sp. H3]